jgi:hypothetical protein
VKPPGLFGSAAVPIAKLRQEIFALGGRHLGDPLAGALLELEDPALKPERRTLLRAVVAHLKAGKTGWTDAASPSPRLTDAAYVGVIIAAAVWVTMIVRAMIA